jgi:hypothetical protein
LHQISILLTFKGRLEGGDVKQNFKDEEEKTAGAKDGTQCSSGESRLALRVWGGASC